ncbi:MAG: iron ABC transporter permease [Spirochaetaceae bacterium]|jgi:iron complex transport system permease protein|nr:iron ABC transporter permease [Spirochaetaceae bacterium]
MTRKFLQGRSVIVLSAIVSLLILAVAVSIGSVSINIADTIRVILAKITGREANVAETIGPIVWNLRLPRVLLAFLAGGALSVCGAVFQSVLKNPLASPYILGVSTGASLGAAIIMLTGFVLPFLGGLTLPLAGFVFGFGSMLVVLAFSRAIDKSISNNTIILFGMVFSLFINAILTTLAGLYREELRNLFYWQMGSFSLKGWSSVGILFPFVLIACAGICLFAKEMDILTFGEEEAMGMGLDTKKVRILLLFLSSLLTGAVTALCGAIGFIDLVAPHLARKFVGSRHSLVIPESFFLGGSLLVLSDLLARTVISPLELPVGAVTAIIGAPFFAWVYFRRR